MQLVLAGFLLSSLLALQACATRFCAPCLHSLAAVTDRLPPLHAPLTQGLSTLNKHLRAALAAETCVYTKDSARFIHGKVAAGNQLNDS